MTFRIHKFQKTTMATEYKVNVINIDNIESYIAERDVNNRDRKVEALNNYFTEWGFKKHCLQMTEKKRCLSM